MAKKKTPSTTTPLERRNALGLNQSDFWSRIGVTQSGGSRYEHGRNMPKPVQILMAIAYGTKAEADTQLAAVRPAK